MGGIRPPTRAKGPDDMATCATGFFYKPYTDSWPSSRPHAAIQTWRRGGGGGTKDPFVRSNAASSCCNWTPHCTRERFSIVRPSYASARSARGRGQQFPLCVRKLLEGKTGEGERGAFLNGFFDTRKEEFFYWGWKIDRRRMSNGCKYTSFKYTRSLFLRVDNMFQNKCNV